MRWNLVGAFVRNAPYGTEIAFRKGLERIGEKVTVVDPSQPNQLFDGDADVNLIVKYMEPGKYRDIFEQLPGKKIIYQVDDLRFPHIRQMMVEMRKYCDHALTFDEDGAALARSYGYGSAQRLLLTADNTLYRHMPGMQKDIDVCFIGSLTGGENHRSRVKMVQRVQELSGYSSKPWRIAVMNEIFDIGKICEIYNRSKIILNHATDVGQPFGHGFGYQCRHFEAGFTKACILSNQVDNEHILKNFYSFDSEHVFTDILTYLMHEDEAREEVAQNLYDELYASHLPEHRGQEMVDFVRSIQ